MNSTIIVSLLALAGTIFGSLLGAISTTKMLTYRIGQLEDKMDKISNLLERVTIIEHKLEDIKDYVKDNCE